MIPQNCLLPFVSLAPLGALLPFSGLPPLKRAKRLAGSCHSWLTSCHVYSSRQCVAVLPSLGCPLRAGGQCVACLGVLGVFLLLEVPQRPWGQLLASLLQIILISRSDVIICLETTHGTTCVDCKPPPKGYAETGEVQSICRTTMKCCIVEHRGMLQMSLFLSFICSTLCLVHHAHMAFTAQLQQIEQYAICKTLHLYTGPLVMRSLNMA